ncbi:unnamed protein product [Hermetia illucens]|uniref:Uncharacterized protein n=1 Tax=Hermetia illucens TaxID=343691 RepID=A0A7R8V048_HERIL|nr:unnamed protein product [Hermetia illucens]
MVEAITRQHIPSIRSVGAEANGVHHILPRFRPSTPVVELPETQQSQEAEVDCSRMVQHPTWDTNVDQAGTMLQVDLIQPFTMLASRVDRMVSTVDMDLFVSPYSGGCSAASGLGGFGAGAGSGRLASTGLGAGGSASGPGTAGFGIGAGKGYTTVGSFGLGTGKVWRFQTWSWKRVQHNRRKRVWHWKR